MMRRFHLPTHRADGAQGDLDFLRRKWRLAVPLELAFEFGDALRGYSVGDDDGRLVENRMCFADGTVDVAEVVAVAFLDMPVPGAPFIDERIQGHDVLGEAVDLDVVPVDDGGQILYLLLASEHGTFPGIARVQFAVRHEAVKLLARSPAVIDPVS